MKKRILLGLLFSCLILSLVFAGGQKEAAGEKAQTVIVWLQCRWYPIVE